MSGSVPAIRSEFEAFLFAPIGDDTGNGMQLSVLSALARQNVDPWEEAGRLAALSREAAILKLSAWIALLPDGKSTRRDAGPIAARLIELLPRGIGSGTGVGTTALDVKSVVQSCPHRRAIVYVIAVVFALAAQWVIAHYLAAGLSHNAATPTSGTVSARLLSPAASRLERGGPVRGHGVGCRAVAQQKAAC